MKTYLITPPILVDLADIVHQGKQSPLNVYLGFGTQRESVHMFLDTNIGEHRLDDGQASGIDQPALWRVYLGFHFIHQSGRLAFRRDHQVLAQHVRLAQTIES